MFNKFKASFKRSNHQNTQNDSSRNDTNHSESEEEILQSLGAVGGEPLNVVSRNSTQNI